MRSGVSPAGLSLRITLPEVEARLGTAQKPKMDGPTHKIHYATDGSELNLELGQN